MLKWAIPWKLANRYGVNLPKTVSEWRVLRAGPELNDAGCAVDDRPKLPQLRVLLRIIDAAMCGLI